MRFGIRLRFALWLVAALLPASVAAIYVLDKMEDEIVTRVVADLEGVSRLEAARIESALAGYRLHGTNLASGPHVRDFTAGVVHALEANGPIGVIGGYDGFAEVDALATLPLQPLAEALQRKTETTTADVAALRIRGRNGEILGETAGFDWEPLDPGLVERAFLTGVTTVGNAYRDSDGADRLGVVAPIKTEEGEVVGALLLETRLGPIVDLVVAHEGFGETSEAHIAQADGNGDAEFITLLRFERDAAFDKVVPSETGLPITQSFTAESGRTVFAPDYRGEESILALQTIDETGWGLVVKIDRAEVVDPVRRHVTALKGVAALGALGVLFGWAAFLDPIARRLRRMAEGAERVASGDYETPLDDRRSDEIGSVASNIDRLATDLAADIAVRTDIENRLRHQATHDATTGLYNRQYATSFMSELTHGLGADAEPYSLLFLDLDDFKSINDVYGHATGDAVLSVTADRLRSVAGERGAAARWGGDEFVVVLPATDEVGAAEVAEQVENTMQTPIETDAGVHKVRASVGASTRLAGESVEDLLHRADQSMFSQKQGRSGRSSVSPESVLTVERALEHDAVEVWFQAVVDGTGPNVALRGAEALVRLRQEDGAVIAPGAFLRDVERSTVGRDLDWRVLRRSLSQVAEWIRSGELRPDFRLSVNCCESTLSTPTCVEFVSDMLAEVGLEPHNLMLEISEASSVVPAETIRAFEALGVHVAVDDLGLNHSNVDRLLDTDVSVAKIDRRWLREKGRLVAQDDRDAAVLSHLVSLCQSLGLTVIAEGVETAEQLAELRALGVACFQGFLFAEPLSAADFASRFLGRS